MRLNDIAVIPRATLFGTPERGSCQVSPCGRRFAFVAPVDGIMNLWVCERGFDVPASFAAARPLTHADRYGIHDYHWSVDGQYLLYLQGKDGDENHHLYAMAVAGGAARDLTPFPRAHATFQQKSRRHPGHVLVTINRRDERFADLYRVDLASGELELVAENPGYLRFIADDDYRVRLALASRADRGIAVMTRGARGWTTWRIIEECDAANTRPETLHADGKTLYMFDSRSRDTAALLAYDIESASDTGRLIAAHDKVDVDGLWLDIHTHAPLAWTATHARREIHLLDDRLRADVAYLDGQGIGDWRVTSRTDDDALWIVVGSSDISPATYYFYDRAAKTLCKLYDAMPALAAVALARMRHTVLKSRDGQDLVSYLTLPVHVDVPGAPLASVVPAPLVLLVHDGPDARDVWGYDSRHQWLANRGYAVLSVNFRGSTGFGKRFVAAGDRQWGAKMDDDLVDAVNWAIKRGIADPQRICIMGAGYGGYATLWSMAAHPRLYACGADVGGPANLATLARSVAPHLGAARTRMVRMIGDVTTAIGRMVMWERSPVYRAGRICRPLLIGQGAHDLGAQRADSEQIVAALKDNRVPVTYILFPDEGHGFRRPANHARFNAIIERFLARHLGGRCEPETPEEVEEDGALLVESALG